MDTGTSVRSEKGTLSKKEGFGNRADGVWLAMVLFIGKSKILPKLRINDGKCIFDRQELRLGRGGTRCLHS